MRNNIYIAKQPILDRDGGVFAYELLYRDTQCSSNIKNRKEATVSVLSSTINEFGVEKLLGRHKAFIKADEEFIAHNVLGAIPKECFIFSLQFDKKVNDKLQKRISKLYEDGYLFAINDTVLDSRVIEIYKDIMEFISFIKVDIATPAANMALLDGLDIEIISTKVEDNDKKQIALERGSKYLQGYYFYEPSVYKEEEFDTDTQEIVRLSNLIMKDCSIDEIVKEFEKSPIVTMRLLKFINSGLFHFRQKLSSIKQVITLVGKTKLTQWLMLMIYSNNTQDNHADNVLFERVNSRTYIMQEITILIDKSKVSNAYFVGVISLMDALFSVSQRTLMKKLHVDKDIKDAILKKEGLLGEIYNFVLAIEGFDTKVIEEFVSKYNIPQEALERISLNASKDLGNVK